MSAEVFRWPVRECLHENSTPGAKLKTFQGETVKNIAPRCVDCGYLFPDEDYENPVGEVPDITREDLG